MLGTVPGYDEYDVSAPFLIALPIFTAMLRAYTRPFPGSLSEGAPGRSEELRFMAE